MLHGPNGCLSMPGTQTYSRNMAQMGKVRQVSQDEDSLEWLAAMCSHVQDKRKQAILYVVYAAQMKTAKPIQALPS